MRCSAGGRDVSADEVRRGVETGRYQAGAVSSCSKRTGILHMFAWLRAANSSTGRKPFTPSFEVASSARDDAESTGWRAKRACAALPRTLRWPRPTRIFEKRRRWWAATAPARSSSATAITHAPNARTGRSAMAATARSSATRVWAGPCCAFRSSVATISTW